jgi:large repetitive protein
VTWTANPAPQSVTPCQLGLATDYTSDTSVTLSCTATWADGSSASFSFPLHVEVSTPTASTSVDRPPDFNDWYTSAVDGQVAGSAFSGIASCSATTYSGPDSTSATVSGTCTDNAGKTVTATSAPFQYEASSPTVSASPSRAADFNGWYTSPVGARLTDSSFSGITHCLTSTYSGPDSTSATVSGTCTDNAGKSTTATSGPFQYEASSPSVSVALSRSADFNNWYTGPVGATLTDSSFSGIASCSTTSYAGPDSKSATVSGTCTDNAGKSTTATSAPFQYEASTPKVSAAPSRGPDYNNWYTSAVSATLTDSSFSGIASCTTTNYAGPDSKTATVAGTCTDNAGKSVTGTSSPFQYEGSNPTVAVSLARSADFNGWYTHPVAATVSGSSYSGIASCTPNTYTGPDTATATVSGSCTDNAGKTADGSSPTFQYEASGPIVTVTAGRSPDFNGWYTAPVSASVSGSSVSGGVTCSGSTYAGPDSTNASVSGTCDDNAGETNTSTSSPFHYEASSPTITVAPSRAPDGNGWYWSPVSASVTGNSFSGIASCTGTSYSGPDTTSATVTGSCTDNAGKKVNGSSAPFPYEASQPTISVVLARSADSNGWFNHPVDAKATGSSFSGIASCTSSTYAGPDATNATLTETCSDNAGKSVGGSTPAFKYEASSPTVTVGLARMPDLNGWYTHPVASIVTGSSYSGIASCAPSTYAGPDTSTATVGGSCTDNAGKTTSGTSPTFEYDASGPIVSISLSRLPDHDGWFNHAISAVVSGVSPLGSVSCTGSTYSGPDATSATVSGTCTDLAGQSNSVTSTPFRYEASSPTIRVALSRLPDASGDWYNHPIAAAVTGASYSGIASCTGTTYSGPDATHATVSGTCVDNAGKSVSGTSAAFAFDDSAPLQSVAAETADQSVTLRWALTTDSPAVIQITRRPMPSGRSTLVYRGTGNSYTDRRVRNGVRYVYTLVATDQAGNVSRESLTAEPGPRLLTPVRGAAVAGALLLSWTPVSGADYYNVQLYRHGRQIFSAWPVRAVLRVNRAWRFESRRVRLTPGRYRWYVWPGYGSRTAAHYGRLIGSSTFDVT